MSCLHCSGPHATSRCNFPIARLRRSLIDSSARAVESGLAPNDVGRELLEAAAALMAVYGQGPREFMPAMFAGDACRALEEAIAVEDQRRSA